MPSVDIMRHKRILLLAAGIVSFGTLWLVSGVAQPVTPTTSPGNIAILPPAGMAGDPVAQPVKMPSNPAQAALIRRGEYLAVAGDCQYCHSLPGGTPYAGGVPLQTPFGAIFSPNITPDKTYGIGSYSNAQFWNVLHRGISPGHSLLVFPHYLYPVMPWQNFNKLSRHDVMAIKAYLDSLPPAPIKSRANEMAFPFNVRAGQLALRILSPTSTKIHYGASWSPQVRNGAFLVEALAHCSACHGQRNIILMVKPKRNLAGGQILAQSWYPPDISSSKTGIGAWSPDVLFNYLHHDGALGAGAPFGPMKAVVEDSLSRLPASDVHDIVAYLQTASPKEQSAIPPATAAAPTAGGAALYYQNCARCHGAQGQGLANNFPNLAGNQALWNGPADNLISMILGGYKPWHPAQSSMPEFNQKLSDTQIAALANYVRTSWGNKAPVDVTAADVSALRPLASDWVELSTGDTQATLNGAVVDDISGTLQLFGNPDNCIVSAHLASSAGTAVDLSGACSPGGHLAGFATLAGKTVPVTLTLRMEGAAAGGSGLSGVLLSGPLGSQHETLNARIALISPTA